MKGSGTNIEEGKGIKCKLNGNQSIHVMINDWNRVTLSDAFSIEIIEM